METQTMVNQAFESELVKTEKSETGLTNRPPNPDAAQPED